MKGRCFLCRGCLRCGELCSFGSWDVGERLVCCVCVKVSSVEVKYICLAFNN